MTMIKNNHSVRLLTWALCGFILLILQPSRVVGQITDKPGSAGKTCPLPQKPVDQEEESAAPRKPLKPEKFSKNKIDYELISFEDLRFDYQPPMDVEHPDGTITKAAEKRMPVPTDIKALDGKKVAIRGFVIPLETNGDNIKTFLFADQLVTCLFCAGLGYDEWVMSTARDAKGFHINEDEYERIFIVYGTFEVGEKFEDGQFSSLYRIKAEGVERIKKFGMF